MYSSTHTSAHFIFYFAALKSHQKHDSPLVLTDTPPTRNATIYSLNALGPNSNNLLVTRKNLPRDHHHRPPPPRQNVPDEKKVLVKPLCKPAIVQKTIQKQANKKYSNKSLIDKKTYIKGIVEECSSLRGQVWIGKYLLKDTAGESKFKYPPLNKM